MVQKYDSVMSVLKVHQMNEPYNLFKFLPIVGYLDHLTFFILHSRLKIILWMLIKLFKYNIFYLCI